MKTWAYGIEWGVQDGEVLIDHINEQFPATLLREDLLAMLAELDEEEANDGRS